MTTTTHSHKPWTDKGGHVNSFQADRVLDGSNNLFLVLFLVWDWC